MKSEKLLEAIGEAREEYVLSALKSKGEKKQSIKSFSAGRMLLVAVITVFVLLLVGCAVVYTFRLQDMKAGEYTFTFPKHLDENGKKVYETEVTKDVLSLQGYTGTPGYLAFQEWDAYKQAHIEPENQETVPMEDRLDYLSYGCDYQEEIDKVNEICGKYGLHKLGIAWLEESPEITRNALGIESLILPDSMAEVVYYQGYYYWDGTFYMPFLITLTEENAPWRQPTFMEMRYVRKAAFSTFGIQVNLEDHHEEWMYKTKQGTEALLTLWDNYALIIVEQSDSFLSVRIDNVAAGEDRMTRQGLESIADVIDFEIVPGKVDVAAAQERYEAVLKQAQEQKKVEGNTPIIFSYRQFVDELIEKTQNSKSLMYGRSPEEFYYCIMDFNEDGIDDFLWGSGNDCFSEVMTIQNGKVELLYNAGLNTRLCEENILEQFFDEPDISSGQYIFVKYQNGFQEEICHIEFDRERRVWTKEIYDGWGSKETITQEEAEAMIKSYKHLHLDMRPITDFPG
mgnify:CR=1 FL=1